MKEIERIQNVYKTTRVELDKDLVDANGERITGDPSDLTECSPQANLRPASRLEAFEQLRDSLALDVPKAREWLAAIDDARP